MLRQYIRKIPGARAVARTLGLAGNAPSRREPPVAKSRSELLGALPRQAVGAEVGVHVGDFSVRLLEETEPRELHLIDPWKFHGAETYKRAWYGGKLENGQAELDRRHQGVCERFRAEIDAGQVHVQRGLSSEILSGFADDSLDWIYIDGNHLYEFVMEDLRLGMRTVKPGGYITGDDYGIVGWWEDGVTRAVTEFAAKEDVEVLSTSGGQFILRKSDAS